MSAEPLTRPAAGPDGPAGPDVSQTAARPSRIGQLPPFYSPFNEYLVHPRAAEVAERAVAWTDRFGIYPDAAERAWGLATHSADFSCRIIPGGDVEPLVLFAQWNYWANAVDDWQDSADTPVSTAAITDHSVRLARALEAPGSAMLPPGPLTTALDDLVARTRAALTPFQLRRFTEGARDWLLGAGWQTANSERGVMPSLADFTSACALANGTRFSLTWSDAAHGIHLPPDTLYSAPVQVLTDAAGFVVSADNDLFSYDKDDDQEPWEQNLVNVVAAEYGCTPAEAVPYAVALRDRVQAFMVRLREQVARTADEPLRRYLDTLGYYVSGSIEWQSRAPRYASPRNRNPWPVEGSRIPVTYRDTPSDPDPGPPPLPVFAWWWHQLTN
ncbi:terpene synthase family protein [Actinacidiphila yeochonensis]|uniref:terpene synthase family protein n=1 Tax=Actinacidiphila yeochonensis TaxID=89050 RepID=UPI000AA06CAF|nr:terpene synthase family protein [Actinacidiphila yeochonensis]